MSEVICGIYEILNKINNKRYIGQSTNIYRRWREHQNNLDKQIHQNKYLQAAWDKYGSDAFEFNIVEICIVEDLDERECFYIEKYNTKNREYGYNFKEGGSHCTDEARKNMSIAQKNKWTDEMRLQKSIQMSGENNPFFGKHHTKETGEKIAKANKMRQWTEESKEKARQTLTGRPGPNKGKITPKETKDKISNALKGRPSPKRKGVIQLDLNGKYIASFDSRTEAARKTGVSKLNICECCNGIRVSAGGYLWKNKEDFNEQNSYWMDITISSNA